MASVARFYLVCAVQRAGTGLLCEMLAATGCAGRPPGDLFDMSVGAKPFDLGAAIKASSTPNGIAGCRMFWNGWEACLARLGAEKRAQSLRATFPGLRFVWLRRRDTLRQAVSFWRATTPAEQFRLPDDPTIPINAPPFDARAIREFLSLIEHQDSLWRQWFAAERITPLEITYEDVDASPAATVRSVLDFLGVRADVATPRPRIKRQADAHTERYLEQFRRHEMQQGEANAERMVASGDRRPYNRAPSNSWPAR